MRDLFWLGKDFTYTCGKAMYGLAGRGEVWKYAHSWQGLVWSATAWWGVAYYYRHGNRPWTVGGESVIRFDFAGCVLYSV